MATYFPMSFIRMQSPGRPSQSALPGGRRPVPGARRAEWDDEWKHSTARELAIPGNWALGSLTTAGVEHNGGSVLPRITPAAPVPVHELADHPDLVTEVKYDGFRCVVYSEGGGSHAGLAPLERFQFAHL